MNRHISLFAAALVLLSSCETGEKVDVVKARLMERREVKPVEVVVLRALPLHNDVSVCYVGTVEASGTSSVTARVPGTLVSIPVKQGQRVKQGETIAVMESQSAISSYETAKAALEQALDGWERVGKVYETGTVTEAKYIEIKTKLEQARASEAAARKALEECTVTAPFSGVVNEVRLTEGVQVNPGDIIMEIVDLAHPEVHFPLPENEFANLRTGSAASVTIPAVGRSFDAVLTAKGVVASRLSHSYDCTLSIRGDLRGVMPGMVCKVYFDNSGAGKRVIPSSAVKTDMVGRYVWTVRDSIVGRKYVKISGYTGNGVVVSYGLDSTDFVIIGGSRKVSTGMKVKAVE